MPQSMTGYGRGAFAHGQRSFRIEIRSVNNRFLDVRCKLPWSDAALETRIVETIKKSLERGRIELTIVAEDGAASALELNRPLAAQLKRLLDELGAALDCDRMTAALLVPELRELVGRGADLGDGDEIWPALQAGLVQALDRLIEMRRVEGRALVKDLSEQLDALRELASAIEKETDEQPQRQAQRLQDRLKRAAAEIAIDSGRLAQEVALIADRSDVHEEIARIKSHIEQVRSTFVAGQAMGRRVEFLIQELGREFNTLAAKTTETAATLRIIDGKSILEKMREQIQNVE